MSLLVMGRKKEEMEEGAVGGDCLGKKEEIKVGIRVLIG